MKSYTPHALALSALTAFTPAAKAGETVHINPDLVADCITVAFNTVDIPDSTPSFQNNTYIKTLDSSTVFASIQAEHIRRKAQDKIRITTKYFEEGQGNEPLADLTGQIVFYVKNGDIRDIKYQVINEPEDGIVSVEDIHFAETASIAHRETVTKWIENTTASAAFVLTACAGFSQQAPYGTTSITPSEFPQPGNMN